MLSKIFCGVLILIGTISNAQQAASCSSIKITRVHILHNEPNDGMNHKGCFDKSIPCFIDIETPGGQKKRIPFLSPAPADKDNMGFSWQCDGVDLDSKGSIADLSLPSNCRISVHFATSPNAETKNQCECTQKSCSGPGQIPQPATPKEKENDAIS